MLSQKFTVSESFPLGAETRSRHMRLPVRLADGSHFRIDMSPVVNAVETLILAAPQEVIARTLRNSLPGVDVLDDYTF